MLAEPRTIRTRFLFESREENSFKFSSLIVAFIILMSAALIYVWSHIRFTELKYRIAKEVSVQERLLEENRKLKVEIATLKSPQRIEAVSRDKLGLQFPEREQVIFLK